MMFRINTKYEDWLILYSVVYYMISRDYGWRPLSYEYLSSLNYVKWNENIVS